VLEPSEYSITRRPITSPFFYPRLASQLSVDTPWSDIGQPYRCTYWFGFLQLTRSSPDKRSALYVHIVRTHAHWSTMSTNLDRFSVSLPIFLWKRYLEQQKRHKHAGSHMHKHGHRRETLASNWFSCSRTGVGIAYWAWRLATEFDVRWVQEIFSSPKPVQIGRGAPLILL